MKNTIIAILILVGITAFVLQRRESNYYKAEIRNLNTLYKEKLPYTPDQISTLWSYAYTQGMLNGQETTIKTFQGIPSEITFKRSMSMKTRDSLIFVETMPKTYK